jgi:hypothetical protein
MSEISIKIKGPISRVVKTKKKAKAPVKPKTKTEAYLEKLKAREYSYNTSPFYDYKTGLQPTYITRQQTIPQLQQDTKHLDLITLLEDIKKKDREEQTGKLNHDSSPPVPFWPGVNDPIKRKDEETTPGSKNQTGFAGRVDPIILEDITNTSAVEEKQQELDKAKEKLTGFAKNTLKDMLPLAKTMLESQRKQQLLKKQIDFENPHLQFS